MAKYKIIGTRINPGKKDYPWEYKYTNGSPVLFDDLARANRKAESVRQSRSYPMRDVKVVPA